MYASATLQHLRRYLTLYGFIVVIHFMCTYGHTHDELRVQSFIEILP